MGLVSWIILGLIAGVIAEFLMGGGLGIIGSIIPRVPLPRLLTTGGTTGPCDRRGPVLVCADLPSEATSPARR